MLEYNEKETIKIKQNWRNILKKVRNGMKTIETKKARSSMKNMRTDSTNAALMSTYGTSLSSTCLGQTNMLPPES